MGIDTASPPRVSVSVWLASAAHDELRDQARGASLPVLARQAAAVGVAAAAGRVGMPGPAAASVTELRAVGYRLNGLVAALNEALAMSATVAQYRALAARIAPMLGQVAEVAADVQLHPPVHRRQGPMSEPGHDADCDDGLGWKLVRVTTDPATAARWTQAAAVAGFRSVANWLRDALAGVYQLPIARPPMLATIEARSVIGRVSGLVAQVQLAADEIAVVDRVCGSAAERAGEVLSAALESLVRYGGDIKARR
ncbi:hypothetical protein [Mycobacteroides abscessus]|uniref:hypothetical protein n=1 Tax=Mycobacteroides abscessus TaxID=36809 RepID=UPI00092756E9|nr:hypothetical protein [Mycobacteroides abscessus]SIN56244.1 Uncharacterised protein [Mycobacteroides abscessus subsp. abscessus]